MAWSTETFPNQIAAEPNITPMIDVLLVLLIVFMVSIQVRSIIPAQVPPPPEQPAGPPLPQIVLELLPGSGFAINSQPIPESMLDATLAQLYSNRPAKLIFVKAAPDRTYQEVVAAMDRSRSAGVQVIGIVPR